MTLGTGIGSAAVTEGRLLRANTLRQVSWADTLLSIIKAAFVIAEIRAAETDFHGILPILQNPKRALQKQTGRFSGN